jgi:hypothetical protein
MSQLKQNHVTDAETADSRWKGLYKVGGVAALIIAVLLLCEIIVFSVWPQPDTVMGYFELFQDNWLVGLLDLDLLGMVAYFMFVPVVLALYIVLRRASESFMAIGTVLFFVGISVFFATNTAFSIFSLSNQYAAATTDAQRAMFLSAGQATLTSFTVGAFQVSYVIVSGAWLIIAAVMLRSSIFSRATASSGILAGATGIGAVALEHTPVIGGVFPLIVALYFAAIVFLVIWVVLAGRRLFQLGRGVSAEKALRS